MWRLFLAVAIGASGVWVQGRSVSVVATTLDDRLVEVLPRVLSSPHPYYPSYILNSYGFLTGNVNLDVELDPSGQVEHVELKSAAHPAFVPWAMIALTRTKFSHAEFHGAPVACKFTYSFAFQVKNSSGHPVNRPPSIIPAQVKGVPPDLDYDFPPITDTFCVVPYPRHLMVENVHGSAKVRFVINQQGIVESGEVLSASQPEFGEALLGAVKTWRFIPARKVVWPWKAAVIQSQDFDAERPDFERRVAKELRRGGGDIVRMSDLDHPLKMVYFVKPDYPRELQREGINGEVLIDAVITKEGQAVLPEVVSATRPELRWPAMIAVSQWFFRPPTVKGQPVDVHARIPVEFVTEMPKNLLKLGPRRN